MIPGEDPYLRWLKGDEESQNWARLVATVHNRMHQSFVESRKVFGAQTERLGRLPEVHQFTMERDGQTWGTLTVGGDDLLSIVVPVEFQRRGVAEALFYSALDSGIPVEGFLSLGRQIGMGDYGKALLDLLLRKRRGTG
jgi:hypothetical protein